MLISSSELLPGDKIISVPAWKKWERWGHPDLPEYGHMIVTKVTIDFISHLPKVEYRGQFHSTYFIAAVMVEIERA